MSTELSDPNVSRDPGKAQVQETCTADPGRGEVGTPHARLWLDWRVASVAVTIVLVVLVWRMVGASAGVNTSQPAVATAPTVAVARVSREELFNEVYIPAEFRPYL